MSQPQSIFEKHNLNPDQILYIFHEGRKSIIRRKDGSSLPLYTPVYRILEALPESDFLSICKGVVVRRDNIVSITKSGQYTMTDGRVFQGRKRTMSTHRRLSKELNRVSSHIDPEQKLSLLEKCSLLDGMPLAFCVIELVFSEDGRGIDFIFRYCNPQMAVLEGVPVEQMIDRSFYEVFRNGDKKWLVSYADVALNGSQRIIHDYSPEINKNLTISCFQPEPGFCACVLWTADD